MGWTRGWGPGSSPASRGNSPEEGTLGRRANSRAARANSRAARANSLAARANSRAARANSRDARANSRAAGGKGSHLHVGAALGEQVAVGVHELQREGLVAVRGELPAG
eukprot:188910-Prorocentrum_minimum.AAC.2